MNQNIKPLRLLVPLVLFVLVILGVIKYLIPYLTSVLGSFVYAVVGGIGFVWLILFVVFRWLMKAAPKSAADILAKGGVEAQANILAIYDTGMKIKDMYSVLRVQVAVQSPDRPQFQTEINGLFSQKNPPQVGSRVTVVYLPHNIKTIAIKGE
ncbi:MAG: hypothetical protein HY817_04930 [Candidatus Abawacabacteria bacterium]|nr:hypothetical protein [Candidatus Abawacabacteria bacterium]